MTNFAEINYTQYLSECYKHLKIIEIKPVYFYAYLWRKYHQEKWLTSIYLIKKDQHLKNKIKF